MRETRYEHKTETTTRSYPVLDITCDKCGRKIDEFADEGPEVGHELTVSLDPDQCVNFYRQRDYCDECYYAVWKAINIIIDAHPDMERDKDYE